MTTASSAFEQVVMEAASRETQAMMTASVVAIIFGIVE
jgi:hypothetical protein